jgi:hypothetical protein
MIEEYIIFICDKEFDCQTLGFLLHAYFRFSIEILIRNILYVQAKLIRIFIRVTEDLSDQPITGYCDAFNYFNLI